MISEKTPDSSQQMISSADSLCSNLSHGLHAAAQPLTILRASLSNTDEMTVTDLQLLVENSAKEVERVCILFSYMQQLVTNESVKPRIAETEIISLIDEVTDGLELLFRESEIELKLVLPDVCNKVVIDGMRTRQALSSVLLLAHVISSSGDTVELTATPSSDSVQIVVTNSNRYPSILSAEARLSMALAEANIRNQQGRFQYALNPFYVCVELPTFSIR
jgi:signal transduction histidine kinase